MNQSIVRIKVLSIMEIGTGSEKGRKVVQTPLEMKGGGGRGGERGVNKK